MSNSSAIARAAAREFVQSLLFGLSARLPTVFYPRVEAFQVRDHIFQLLVLRQRPGSILAKVVASDTILVVKSTNHTGVAARETAVRLSMIRGL